MAGFERSRKALIPLVVALTVAVLAIYAIAPKGSYKNSRPAKGRDISQIIRSAHSPGHFTNPQFFDGGGTCLFGHAAMGGQPKPDWTCTTGVLETDVNDTTFRVTICRAGYLKDIVPPSAEVEVERAKVFRKYGLDPATPGVLGWLIPPELGGANDPMNLWPMLPEPATAKTRVDGDLHQAVCAGRVKLSDAQVALISDWTFAEFQLGLARLPSLRSVPPRK